MATPKRKNNGVFTLMVTFEKRRKNLTLGKVDRRGADLFAINVDRLVDLRKRGEYRVPRDLEGWIQGLSDRHQMQLSEIGLLGEIFFGLTVRDFVQRFEEDYAERDLADSTKRQLSLAMMRFPDWFMETSVSSIEPTKQHHRPNAIPVFSKEAKSTFLRVESWQREHYAKSSWSKANQRMRSIGIWAVERGLCDYNPFTLLSSPGEVNQDRNVYVEVEWVDDAMDYCIDPDTRLLFALGRFAGFRLPSEARTLKPGHIDFNANVLKVFDSKKREFREMPLFERIRTELLRHKSNSEWGRFVFSERFRSNADSNNYQLMVDAVDRTEHARWHRLRQNLRSSCENHLLRMGFPERLVSVWLGHTIVVSRKHYQKQAAIDFIEAVKSAEF